MSTLQESMQTVMRAFQIQREFFQNVSDLFALVDHEMKKSEPSYTAVATDGSILSSEIDVDLFQPKQCQIRHLAFPLRPTSDESLPLLLVHVCVDEAYASLPEVWLGSFSEIETRTHEAFPYPDAISSLFQDYFGPNPEWREIGSWYEETVSDGEISACIGFCRIPLSRLTDPAAVRKEICTRFLDRLQILKKRAD